MYSIISYIIIIYFVFIHFSTILHVVQSLGKVHHFHRGKLLVVVNVHFQAYRLDSFFV